MSLVFAGTVSDALLPRLLTVTVEDNEVAFVNRTDRIHIFPRLLKSVCNDDVQRTPFDFQFQDDALYRYAVAVAKRFSDKEFGALAPQSVLAVYVTTAVNSTRCRKACMSS